MRVGIGLSTEKNLNRAVQSAIKQAAKNIGPEKINLAIVFSSTEFVHSTILKTIRQLLGPIAVVGSSSIAIISNQGIFKQGLVIMLLSLSEGLYVNTAFVDEMNAKPNDAGERLGEKLLSTFKNTPRHLGIIFSDGLTRHGTGFLYGLQQRMGRSFPLVGASIGDDLTFKKTSLYFNQGVLNDAACGTLWGGKVNFGLGIKHGWKPLGKPRYVTKSYGNTVYEIDGLPAVNIYKEYFAAGVDQLKKDLKRISIFYPIGIYLPGEEEYLLRNILSIEKNGSLIFQGNVPEGSPIRLMIGTKESCLAATRQALKEAKESFTGHAMNFVLVFNSISRYILLGRRAHKELAIIKEELGEETPIIGIYTYGELAPLKAVNYQGRTYFHNQAITILGIGS